LKEKAKLDLTRRRFNIAIAFGCSRSGLKGMTVAGEH
jgi:hypothetical protein